MGYKTYKAQKVPNRRDKQNENARKRALKLYNEVLIKHKGCVNQDDKTYLKCDFKQMPGQEYYLKRVGKFVDNKLKSKYVEKIAKRFMIWQAICSCGRRTLPYVIAGSLKSSEYIKECLDKRLLPRYRQHNVSPLFWPDLASIHYSGDTFSWYEENDFAYIKKIHNPTNSPEHRLIERYWAILKCNVKKTLSPATDIKSFKKKLDGAIKSIDKKVVQNLMGGVKGKVRKFGRGEKI